MKREFFVQLCEHLDKKILLSNKCIYFSCMSSPVSGCIVSQTPPPDHVVFSSSPSPDKWSTTLLTSISSMLLHYVLRTLLYHLLHCLLDVSTACCCLVLLMFCLTVVLFIDKKSSNNEKSEGDRTKLSLYFSLKDYKLVLFSR